MSTYTPIYTRLFAALINSRLSFVLTVSLLSVVGIAVVGPSRYKPVDAHVGPNSAPIAVDDGPYTVHGSMWFPQVMSNDSDPDGDTIGFDIIGTNPAHGNLSFGATPGIIGYNVTHAGYVGPDSFTYRIGDQHGTKSGFATVYINVVNQSPIAATDNYTVHGATMLTHPKANDSDPDGDPIFFDIIVTPPAHGNISFPDSVNMRYTPQAPYVGPDSFTYRIKDSLGAIAIGTVNLDVQNQPPTAVTDNYTVHGPTMLLPHPKANDFDPDGDTFVFDVVLTSPAHGSISFPDGVNLRYNPSSGYVGPDSFTYRIRDSLSLNATGTVNLTVQNQAPIAIDDSYTVRGSQLLTPSVLTNDFDPDPTDTISFDAIVQNPAHGSVSIGSGNALTYTPQSGYAGTDSFTYKIRDNLNLRSAVATVTLHVLGGGRNDGIDTCLPRKGPLAVGQPVNVSNGNMYLQHDDYMVPGVGNMLLLERTYNSQSTLTGLFGKGWSTAYDEALQVYDSNTIRLNEPDGRATYFGRPIGSSGVFSPLQGDFQGQLTQTAGGYTLSLKDGSTHQFNSTGRLLSLTDRNGNQTTLAYNLSGKLTSVTDPFGRQLSFVFNGDRVSQITDTTGIIADYTYSNVTGANQKLLTVTYADASGYTFAYDANHRLTTVTDKLNNILEAHAYDSQGRATTSEKQGGVEHLTLNYVSPTETDVTDALGRVTKYFFDTSKDRNVLTSIEGVCSCGSGSQVKTWVYDNSLNLTSSTDALGHITSYTYDIADNLLTMTDPTGTVTYTYNSFGQVLTYTDQMGGVLTNTYDAHGNVLTTKDPLNNTTTFTYNSQGQLLTVTDPRNNTTTFSYNTNGDLVQRTDALNNQTNIAYDARSRITTITNALNQVTAYEYDLAGRLKKLIYPDTNFLLFTYDLAGRRTKIQDPRGYETTFLYDAAYRLTGETNADNKTTSYEYDLMSNLTGVTDALNRTTNYEYDDFNRLKKIKFPEATVGAGRLEENFTYDLAGNLLEKKDQANRITSFSYDSANRLTTSTDPALNVTAYEYNPRSQLTAVVDAINQRYEFTYDALGRVTQDIKGTATKSFVYDAAGNRSQRTDYNGAVTNYSYDALNRLTTISYPDTTSATYGYDVLSRMTTATNATGTVTIAYDNRGRVSSVMDVFGQVVGYQYDANSNRTQLNLNGSLNASYQYDVLNRLTLLTDNSSLNTTFVYDSTNKLTSRTLPNGVVSTYQYDGLNRLTRLTHAKGANTLADFEYQSNSANNVTQIIDNDGTHNYSYDSLDRLTAATHPNQPNESYTYDDVGNRTASHQGSSYSYQAFNRLVSANGTTFGYDTNGNQLSKTDASGIWTYTWDYENRLKQGSLSGGVSVNYSYDALSRRVQQSSTATGTLKFIYDGPDVVRDLDAGGNTIAEYLNTLAVDSKLRQTTSGNAAYFLSDHLGTTRSLTDAAGNVSSTLQYDSYGNVTGSSALTRYTYTGREMEFDLGVMYYRARWYDPQSGRFMSEDPIGRLGGLNLFEYVHGNPIVYRDPEGLQERRIGPETPFRGGRPAYNCMAWAIGYDDRWVEQGRDGVPLDTPWSKVPGYYGCRWIRCNQRCACSEHKVKLYDQGETNVHAERKDCGQPWTSKNGQSFLWGNISDPDDFYRRHYPPAAGSIRIVCWCCPNRPSGRR